MKRLSGFLLFILIIFLPGCDYKEINDLGIVSAIGIEAENDEFLVTAQLINIKKSDEKSDSANVTTFTASGKTIYEAVMKISTQNSRELYFAHMKLLILDNLVVENNILEVIDFFARDNESMFYFPVLVSKERLPSEILKILAPFEAIPAEFIEKTLTNSEFSLGTSRKITFEEYIEDLISDGIDPVYTKINLIGDEAESDSTTDITKTEASSQIKIGNILVYNKQNNLVELSEVEAKVYNILMDNAGRISFSLKCGESSYTAKINTAKISKKFDIQEKNINYNIKLNFIITDYSCGEDLLKKEAFLEDEISTLLEEEVKKLFKKSKEFNSDFLGIGKYINSRHSNYFDFKKYNWNASGLINLNISVKVNSSIEKNGNLSNSINGVQL